MAWGKPKHVHDLRLAGHYSTTAGLPAAMTGDLGQTVLLFACPCGSGPDSIATKVIPGRWGNPDLAVMIDQQNGARHAMVA